MENINLSENLITNVDFLAANELYPHEMVILERKNKLIKYLKSSEIIVIPSIICCDKTNMIIDGHHRYFALKELGINKIPTTFINYNSNLIRTHCVKELSISKEDLISASIGIKPLFNPKTSLHQIQDINKSWKPIILLSKLYEILK